MCQTLPEVETSNSRPKELSCTTLQDLVLGERALLDDEADLDRGWDTGDLRRQLLRPSRRRLREERSCRVPSTLRWSPSTYSTYLYEVCIACETYQLLGRNRDLHRSSVNQYFE